MEKLEKEMQIRNEKLDQKKEQQKGWLVYKEYKEYLEENEKDWASRKKEREIERERKERLHEAGQKQQVLREKILERKLEESIANANKELPEYVRRKLENEREGKERMELLEIRRNLWKLKGKERKYFENKKKSERVARLEKIQNLDRKLENLEEIKEEERKAA